MLLFAMLRSQQAEVHLVVRFGDVGKEALQGNLDVAHGRALRVDGLPRV
jgi:hypothetical protein